MRTPLIAGNWKMYKTIPEAIETVIQLRETTKEVATTEIVVAPPFVALAPMANVIGGANILLAGQNVFWEKEGAFTGEISPAMLRSAGCSYTLIGHSERRQYFGENDETVSKKIRCALQEGLKVILCFGESLQERESGLTFPVLEAQLANGLKGLAANALEQIVLAYEPVWAIGTGKTATPAQAEEVHRFVREKIEAAYGSERAESIRILYGGSVKPDNIDELMNQKDIDGALVGGASLQVASFTRIIKFRSLS